MTLPWPLIFIFIFIFFLLCLTFILLRQYWHFKVKKYEKNECQLIDALLALSWESVAITTMGHTAALETGKSKRPIKPQSLSFSPPPWWPSKWKLFQGEGIFVWAHILTIYIDWCWLMIRKFKTKRKYQICRMAGVNVIEWPNVLVELKENRKRLTRTKVGINYGIKRHTYSTWYSTNTILFFT